MRTIPMIRGLLVLTLLFGFGCSVEAGVLEEPQYILTETLITTRTIDDNPESREDRVHLLRTETMRMGILRLKRLEDEGGAVRWECHYRRTHRSDAGWLHERENLCDTVILTLEAKTMKVVEYKPVDREWKADEAARTWRAFVGPALDLIKLGEQPGAGERARFAGIDATWVKTERQTRQMVETSELIVADAAPLVLSYVEFDVEQIGPERVEHRKSATLIWEHQRELQQIQADAARHPTT